jgi:hypothetical protein
MKKPIPNLYWDNLLNCPERMKKQTNMAKKLNALGKWIQNKRVRNKNILLYCFFKK